MLSHYSVKKPYTIVVAIVLVLILGVVSYSQMSVDLIPSINLPYAVVTTTYAGASPEAVEQTVTTPIEQAMVSVNNIQEIQSVSSENLSMVILKFNEDTNMDSALIEMRESLDLLSSMMPDEVGSPIITKLNPEMMPIVVLSASVEGMESAQAANYITDRVLPEIESTPGVASVSASGQIQNQIDVTLSGEKIDSLNASIQSYYRNKARKEIRSAVTKEVNAQVESALAQQKQALLDQGMPEEMADAAIAQARPQAEQQAASQIDSIVSEQMKKVSIPDVEITEEMVSGLLSGQNFSMPSGSIQGEDGADYLVRVGEKFQSTEELKALEITEIPGYGKITLDDVATISVHDNADTMYSRVNGEYAMMLTVNKQPDYSTAEVSNAVQDRMAAIQAEHPEVRFTLLMDQGEYVDLMISTILSNLLWGAGLAIVILVLFLRRIKPTVVVGVSIFISVVFAFVLMYLCGVTLNVISMGGLALGVGMLVDNSIVVIENIFRMRQQGVGRIKAAIEGAKEVSGAITSSTLTTIVVFVPIIFTQGITRQLFTDMALTIAFSLIASLLVALTLVPACCAGLFKGEMKPQHGWIEKMTQGYANLLAKALKHRWLPLSLAVVLLFVSGFMAISSGTELFPSMDTGNITVSVEMPQTYTKEDTFAALDQLSETLLGLEDLETLGVLYSDASSTSGGVMSMMGSGTTIYVQLKEDRQHSTQEVVDQIRQQTKDFAFEVTASGSNADMSALSGGQIVVDLYGQDLDALQQSAQTVADTIAGVEGTADIDNGLGRTETELRIIVDKQKAIENGLTVAQVYLGVNEALAAEQSTTTLTQGDLDYEIYVKDDRKTQIDESSLLSLTIENGQGDSVKLEDVASVAHAQGLSSISHKDQERHISVTGSVQSGYAVGDVNQDIEKALANTSLAEGCRYEVAGENETIQSSFRDLYLMLVLAILFIYLVMVAQFQSLLSPFIVMFTIPLAFTGGFFALFLCGQPVSIVALIGFVLLVGVVVNNGIVFVDYANQQMERGMEKREALILTGKTRLRPILMTALTTIIALLTMALDPSSGAEMLRPMAITTIGGMTYATLLTLFVVPCIYDLLRRKKPGRPGMEESEQLPSPQQPPLLEENTHGQ